MTDTVKQPASQIVTCPTCGRANRFPFAAPGKPTCAVCHSPLIALDHGQPLARQVGALPASQLERWIEEALAKTTAGRA
ncbi:MAG: hypothetical protein JWM18_1290 [Chloroflexi bacterium]|jgi:hypothetical protein|nr:hypothetical protein [Chloroflexota bacterium]